MSNLGFHEFIAEIGIIAKIASGFGYGGPELGTDQGHMDRQIADVCTYVEGSYVNQ